MEPLPAPLQEWNYQVAQETGLLKHPPLVLPSWDHTGEDPLEDTPRAGAGVR